MQQVHRKFTGQKGTFAHFGDSITVSRAFWAGLPFARKNASAEMEQAFQRVNRYMRPECWRDWKGAPFGNEGGMTICWAQQNIDQWLRRLNPEVALIMFGTNDLHALELDEYRAKLRLVVQKCLDNGTVVILSTIPPRHGCEEKAERFVQAIREVAREMHVPLTDFYAEILRRRPHDWDGALEKFRQYQGYDVPTLLARDGVHPSHPQKYAGDYSEEALSHCGYSLWNYLVLMKYAEVIDKVLTVSSPESAAVARLLNQPWFPQAPPLPPPAGAVIRVSNVEELFAAAEKVQPGGTILLADGHYFLPRYFEIKTDNVTLRSESGCRERVILDGAKSVHGELVGLRRCAGVTIADLTIQNIKWNGFKLNTDSNVQRVTIYNCVIRNIWQRGVKGVKVPPGVPRPQGCRIQYCLFYNDRAKRFEDDPADTPQNFGGNYIGGIDVMFAKNWVISDNVFIGIQGRTRAARGAIFLWHDTQDCLVERNIIIDCDTGIALGNSYRPPDITTHCTRVIARNNFITRAPESGIVADYTQDCQIVHNTVHDPDNRLGRLIRLVHDNDGLLVANNLLSGPKIRNESPSNILFRNNLEGDLTSFLVDPTMGNLRLTAQATAAIDRAVPLADVTEDIDRRPRGSQPDIGAHE
ncbi:MAG: right-handed parallel beta-helix repeat-containing protein [Abditibacteriales bacterium]|nr:right-handed parallel beta-helix repeat-containing protein [Abditibacteriales bacterium]MDW8364927.1 right-handed parallel beta-helix repeat-containing protein [Abditibacteriales bacterium]